MEDARVHCVVLKVRAVPTPTTETGAGEGPRGTATNHKPKDPQSAPGPSGPNSVHVSETPTRTVPVENHVLNPETSSPTPHQMFHP